MNRTLILALSLTVLLASCGSNNATVSQVSTSSATAQQPGMIQLTQAEYQNAIESVKKGIPLSKLNKFTPQVINVPFNFPVSNCASAQNAGNSGVISSSLAYGNTTYRINVSMYNPSLYTSYSTDVFANMSLIADSSLKTFDVGIARNSFVEVDSFAQGPRGLFSAGFLFCKTSA